MKGISEINLTENVALVTFNNVPADMNIISDIFARVSGRGVNVDMISQTAPIGEFVTISFTCDSKNVIKVLEVVNEFKKTHPKIKSMVSDGHSKVHFFGREMKDIPGVAADIMKLAAVCKADVSLITTSELDVSILVNNHKAIDIIEKAKA